MQDFSFALQSIHNVLPNSKHLCVTRLTGNAPHFARRHGFTWSDILIPSRQKISVNFSRTSFPIYRAIVCPRRKKKRVSNGWAGCEEVGHGPANFASLIHPVTSLVGRCLPSARHTFIVVRNGVMRCPCRSVNELAFVRSIILASLPRVGLMRRHSLT